MLRLKLLRKITSKVFELFFVAIYRVEVGGGNRFHGIPVITNSERISIGDRNVFCSDYERTALGVRGPVKLSLLSDYAEIKIGSDNGFSGTIVCAMKSVSIGSNCLFGADVIIFDTDFHPKNAFNRRYSKVGIESEPVSIGDNVFIGTASIICKGVSIGENSIVGAGSVVTKDIPANTIVAGNPSRVIGEVPNES